MSAVRAIPLCFLLFAGGCASEPPYQILTPFHAEDFQFWKKTGPYTVSGQAFYKRPDGQVISCAGETVSLMPLTSYNMELSKLFESGKGIPPNYEKRAHKFDHTAMCDGDGRFSFSGLPAMNWLLVTHVAWQENGTFAEVPWIGGPSDKGGWLTDEVSIESATSPTQIKVTLSNQNFVPDKN